MSKEAQALLDAAFAGTLDLNAPDGGNGTSNQAIPASAPTGQEANTNPPATAAGATAQDDEQAGAPIASKSGGYTIPYEKLTEARTQRDQFKAENEQLKAQLEQLSAAQAANFANAQADAQARADAGQAPTQADQNLAIAQAAASQGVDIAVFGDFSEEALAQGIATLVEQRASALVDAKLSQVLAPIKQREAQNAADAHSQAIYTAHPDADEVFESTEFKDWMGNQPSFARTAIEQTLKAGTTQQVIEVFDAFKGATGKAGGNPAAKAVQDALAKAQDNTPVSLSALPGVAPTGNGDAERAAALAGDPAALLEFMATLSPEKQLRLMNSVV